MSIPPQVPNQAPRGPDENKELAAELGLRTATDLIVLSRGNDPYYLGSPAHWRDARWFEEIWKRFGYTKGVHLRRVHYQLFSTRGLMPDGEPYENTDACFATLLSAGVAARVLRLVDPEAFVDRRNNPVQRFVLPRDEEAEPWCKVDDDDAVDNWSLPWIPFSVQAASLGLPGLATGGYDYHPDDQPVLLEVWVEKSTMNDILDPLCRELHVNLQVASGFESITHAAELLRRAEEHDKPAHVFYVSDFDPAGVHMPVTISRQVQFWQEELGIDAVLTIDPVVLTAEQVDDYDLPRAPVKVDKAGKEDARGKRFERRHGEGIVELDALEALHPGVLADTLRHAIEEYLDLSLPYDLSRAEREAQALADQRWEQETAGLRSDLDELEKQAMAVADRYRDRLKRLAEEMADEMKPHDDRLEKLQEEAHDLIDSMTGSAGSVTRDLPDRPEANEPDPSTEALYDSRRHWWDQLRKFKERLRPSRLSRDEVLAVLVGAGSAGLTRQAVGNEFRKDHSPEEIAEALKELEGKGLVEMEKFQPKLGRPGEIWRARS